MLSTLMSARGSILKLLERWWIISNALVVLFAFIVAFNDKTQTGESGNLIMFCVAMVITTTFLRQRQYLASATIGIGGLLGTLLLLSNETDATVITLFTEKHIWMIWATTFVITVFYPSYVVIRFVYQHYQRNYGFVVSVLSLFIAIPIAAFLTVLPEFLRVIVFVFGLFMWVNGIMESFERANQKSANTGDNP